MLTELRGAFEPIRRLLMSNIMVWINSTLVVVDMQPAFFPEIDTDVLTQVANEIRRAMRLGRAIVIVETNPHKYGSTFRSLLDLTAGYHRVAFARKRGMDGSRSVAKVCRRRGFDRRHFDVCGVYTHYCVEETAIGLGLRCPRSQVRVIKKACADPGGNNWPAFPTRANVCVV